MYWRRREGHSNFGLSKLQQAPIASKNCPSTRATPGHAPADWRFAAPARIIPALADEGIYIASESSFHRVLRAHGQMNRRGRARPPRASSPPRTHIATRPGEVWCWDVTFLPARIQGRWFYLYLGPVELPRHWPRAVRQDPRWRPASRPPALPDTGPVRGTRRSALPRPSQRWRSPPAIAPPPSSADCRQRDRQIRWPARRHANAPVSLRSLPPHATHAPPKNSPAVAAALLSDPCTPVRIEPLPIVRAPQRFRSYPGDNFPDTGGGIGLRSPRDSSATRWAEHGRRCSRRAPPAWRGSAASA